MWRSAADRLGARSAIRVFNSCGGSQKSEHHARCWSEQCGCSTVQASRNSTMCDWKYYKPSFQTPNCHAMQFMCTAQCLDAQNEKEKDNSSHIVEESSSSKDFWASGSIHHVDLDIEESDLGDPNIIQGALGKGKDQYLDVENELDVLMPLRTTQESIIEIGGFKEDMDARRGILNSSTWVEVRDRLRVRKDDHACVETAWNVLKTLKDNPDQGFLDELARCTVDALDDFSPRSFSILIQACSSLKYVSKEMLEKWAEKLLEKGNFRSFSPRNLSSIFFSVGSLHRWAVGRRNMLDKRGQLFSTEIDVLNTALRELMARMNELAHHDLSGIVFTLGTLKFQGPDRVFERFVEEINKPIHLARFTESDMALVVHGIACSPTPALLNQCEPLFHDALRRKQVANFSTRQLVIILRALCNPNFRKFARKRLDVRALVDQALTPLHLGNLTPRTIRHLVLAIGVYFPMANKLWRMAFDHISTNMQFSAFSGFDISTVLYAMGMARWQDTLAMEECVNQLIEGGKAHELNTMGLSNVLFGISSLKYRNRRLITMLASRGMQHGLLENASDVQLANMLFSLSLTKCRRESLGFAHHIARTIVANGREKTLSSYLLANVVFGMANLACECDDALDVLMREVAKEERVLSITNDQLSMVVYALGVLKCPRDILSPILSEIQNRDRLPRFDGKDLARIFRFLLQAGVEDKEIVRNVAHGFSMDYVSYMSDACLLDLLQACMMFEPFEGAFVGRLVDEAVHRQRIGRYPKSMLSQFALILSKLCVREGLGPPYMSFLETTMMENKLHELNCDALQATFSCLGHFRKCEEHFLVRLGQASVSVDRMSGYYAQGLVTLFYNMGLLNMPDRSVLKALSQEVVKPHRLESLHNTDMLKVFKGMYVSKWRDRPMVTALLDRFVTKESLADFDRNLLANTVYSMTLLAVWESPWVDRVLEEVCKPERLVDFGEWHLGILMYSIGRMRHRDQGVVSKLAGEGLREQRLVKMSALDLVNTVHGLASINYDRTGEVNRLMTEVLKPGRVLQYTVQQLVRIVHSCSTWEAIEPSSLTNIIEKLTCREVYRQLPPKQLLSTLHAFSRMQMLDRVSSRDILGCLTEQAALGSLNERELHTLHYLVGTFQWDCGEEVNAVRAEVDRRVVS